MRIIAGKLKGRIFDSPHTQRTHPMSDKVRGALFNMLGDIEGLSVCDPFSGSGALAYEAVSRGAASAIAIEADRQAQKVIAANIRQLGLGNRIKLIQATANAWLSTRADMFDIVILDPPYADLQLKLLLKLAERTKKGGIVALSLPPKTDVSLAAPVYEKLTTKSYGDAELHLYRKTM